MKVRKFVGNEGLSACYQEIQALMFFTLYRLIRPIKTRSRGNFWANQSRHLSTMADRIWGDEISTQLVGRGHAANWGNQGVECFVFFLFLSLPSMCRFLTGVGGFQGQSDECFRLSDTYLLPCLRSTT